MTDLPTSRIDIKAVLSGSSPTVAMADHSEGMSYLESVPRRLVTLYLPLAIIVFVLLFPFYWMGLTAIKPDEQLLDLEKFNPFWTWNPTFKHIQKLLSALAVEHDVCGRLCHYAVDHRQRACRICDRAVALSRRAVGRRLDFPFLPGAAVNPVHSARHRRVPVRPVRFADGADPDLSDHPDPVLDVAVNGLFQDHPVRAGRMRADRWREPPADPDQDRAAAGDSRLDLGVHLLLHAVLERIHLCADFPAIDPEQDGAGR